MKLRLSQSKSGSTDALNLRHELLLHAFHFRSPGRRFVIKASEMKEAVRNVETQLVLERRPERAGLAPGCFHADHDFAVLESDHVSRAGFIEEAAMKLRNSPIGNEDDVYFTGFRKHVLLPSSKLQTFDESYSREVLKRIHPNRHRPLPIRNGYRRGLVRHEEI